MEARPGFSQRAEEAFTLAPDPRATEWWPNGQSKTMLLTTVEPRLVDQLVKVNDAGVPQRSALTYLNIKGVTASQPGPAYRGYAAQRSRSRSVAAASSDEWSGWHGSDRWRDNRGFDEAEWPPAPPAPPTAGPRTPPIPPKARPIPQPTTPPMVPMAAPTTTKEAIAALAAVYAEQGEVTEEEEEEVRVPRVVPRGMGVCVKHDTIRDQDDLAPVEGMWVCKPESCCYPELSTAREQPLAVPRGVPDELANELFAWMATHIHMDSEAMRRVAKMFYISHFRPHLHVEGVDRLVMPVREPREDGFTHDEWWRLRFNDSVQQPTLPQTDPEAWRRIKSDPACWNYTGILGTNTTGALRILRTRMVDKMRPPGVYCLSTHPRSIGCVLGIAQKVRDGERNKCDVLFEMHIETVQESFAARTKWMVDSKTVAEHHISHIKRPGENQYCYPMELIKLRAVWFSWSSVTDIDHSSSAPL
jgi:hypothetical protein